MQDKNEHLEWVKHQIELQSFHNARYLEAFKAVHEYSKLAISNLILINAGGIAAIPVISSFVKLDSLGANDRIDLFKGPALGFAIGLFLALVCLMASYFNANYFIAHSDSSLSHAANIFWKNHPTYQQSDKYKDIVDNACCVAERQSIEHGMKINIWQAFGIIAGLLSAGSFVISCWNLFAIKLPMQ
ncbi:hypothetical protein M2322_000406 [Rhodoblastus acidophilus]|uniref:hypothetical protein n=1 Tax=Rhodoblastus acidophilus TaxID=1074 RepID=UPI00222545B8|nr:hypothetical protein [Rhodoblastus acidophilus]MCW2314886.1 hypothetical protein [Rhodoblastus acidophilus]